LTDPLRHEDLVAADTQQAAQQLYQHLDDYSLIHRAPATLLALAWAFEDGCKLDGIDPSLALDQILDLPRPAADAMPIVPGMLGVL
jgi:hypothetical protein